MNSEYELVNTIDELTDKGIEITIRKNADNPNVCLEATNLPMAIKADQTEDYLINIRKMISKYDWEDSLASKNYVLKEELRSIEERIKDRAKNMDVDIDKLISLN